MRLCRFNWIALFLGCFLSSVPELTECAELNITLEQNTTIHINMTSTRSECEVCITQDTQLLCKPSVIISSDTLLKFSCSQPENIFTVHIITDVGQIHNIDIKPKEYPAFQKFNRTFSWNIEPPRVSRPYNLDFYSVGLRQIPHTDACPDKHIYTITAKTAVVGRFCQNGNIKEANVHYGKVSLEISGGQLLNSRGFSVGLLHSYMYELAQFIVIFSEKGTEDISVNYPKSSPSDSIAWHITVPPLYYTHVHVLNYTVPTCLNTSFPKMIYMWQTHDPQIIELNDIQLLEESGNLLLKLENCETFAENAAQNSLMVHFQISALLRTKGQCTGRVPENQILQIRVKRKDPKSACLLKLGSVILDTVTIASGKYFELNFLDCNKNDLELSIDQTIESKEWRNCSNTSLPLINEPHCVPGILKTITWHLHGPENSAVELLSPASGFCQSMPERKCNSDTLIDVSHNNRGFTVGQFCVNGAIQSIQIHDSNIAVSFTNINDRSQLNLPTINYLFKRELSEDYIFTVDPKKHYPVFLVTPAWPSGMNPSYTVSWIVILDPRLKSKLKFTTVSKPICKERSTSVSITVQSIDSQQTLYSTNKDPMISEVPVLESFYLNMTNCKSPTGDFKAMMQITLQYSPNQLLAMSIVGILLVMIITAMVVCFILRRKRKRKSKRAPPTSNYNNDVNAVLPGLNGIPVEEVDPHLYTYIDDTLAYYSILKNTKNQCEECTMDGSDSPQSDTQLPDRPTIKGPTITDDMLIDNELYGSTQGKSTTSE